MNVKYVIAYTNRLLLEVIIKVWKLALSPIIANLVIFNHDFI